MFVLVRAKKYLSRNYSQLLFYSSILYSSKYYCYWHVPTVVGVSSSLLISCPCCRCWICLKRWSTIKRFQSVKLAFIYTSKSCSLTQWMNSVPPYVRKLHFMYEVVRTSSKCRWSIYRTSSKCHWSIFVHQEHPLSRVCSNSLMNWHSPWTCYLSSHELAQPLNMLFVVHTIVVIFHYGNWCEWP